MRGFPKHLATPADVELCKKLYPTETEVYLKRVAEGRFIWEQEKALTALDPGKTSDTQKVVEAQDEAGKIIRVQMAKKTDLSAHWYKLGYTDEDVPKLDQK